MTQYVALLRGIAPTNPNMRNEKLRGVFEKLGFTEVKTVISSGNVIFESRSRSATKLEAMIEKALPEQLRFESITIIQSKAQLQRLVDKDPFKGLEHSRQSYLIVTFLKRKITYEPGFPYKVGDRGYTILEMHDRALCSVIEQTGGGTPDFMVWLEKKFGKEITTRTWKTVERILKAMG